jgi:hypothetical protein
MDDLRLSPEFPPLPSTGNGGKTIFSRDSRAPFRVREKREFIFCSIKSD